MTQSKSSVPMRFSDALNRLDGDEELLVEMARITAPDFRPLVKDAGDAVAREDAAAAIAHLHKLKGMLSTFESDGIVLEIQDMLHAARGGNVGVARDLFQQHRDGILELVSAVEELT